MIKNIYTSANLISLSFNYLGKYSQDLVVYLVDGSQASDPFWARWNRILSISRVKHTPHMSEWPTGSTARLSKFFNIMARSSRWIGSLQSILGPDGSQSWEYNESNTDLQVSGGQQGQQPSSPHFPILRFQVLRGGSHSTQHYYYDG